MAPAPRTSRSRCAPAIISGRGNAIAATRLPVAVPIAWGELAAQEHAHPFSIRDAERLLARSKGKGLAGWGFAEQHLPDF